MAITRELAVSTIESILASQYGANQISFRDVMVRNDQVSVTILGAAQEQQSAIEAVLLDSLKEAGATALYCRFRDSGVAATAHQQQESGASKQQSQPKVQGHGANLQSPLLTEQSNVNFIAIASGKGGVGKSTVTVNLATALARSGKRVGIIDADIYGFSVPDMMGIEERPEVINDRVIPIERFGVKVISMGFFVEDNSPIVWRGPMLGKMLRNFFQEIEWGNWIMCC